MIAFDRMNVKPTSGVQSITLSGVWAPECGMGYGASALVKIHLLIDLDTSSDLDILEDRR